MPTIPQYFADNRILRPDEKGFAAFETAGRRLGGLYNQAGQDERRIGQLREEEIRSRGWPWNILALEQRARANGGVRVNLGRSSNAFPGNGHSMDAHFATLAAGEAISAWMAGADRQAFGNAAGGQLIDVTGGTTSLGRQMAIGTAFPASKGGLIDVGPTPTAPTAESPIVNVPADTDPDFYGRQIGVDPNGVISQQPLPGSAQTTAAGNGGGGFFDGLRDYLNNLTGASEDAGADLGAGPMTGF